MNAKDTNDHEERDREIAERRLKTYSLAALATTVAVDRALVLHRPFQDCLSAMDRVFQLGRELINIPVGLRLVAPPGGGKTTILNYFCKSLPKSDLFEPGFGAVRIHLKRRASLAELVSGVLLALQYPLPATNSSNVLKKRELALELLGRKGTRLLALDDAHRLCVRGKGVNGDEGNDATSFLCDVTDARIGLVLCGGPGLDRLRDIDSYLFSRCTPRVALNNFKLGGAWGGLVSQLIGLTSTHSLKFLDDKVQMANLHSATNGNLRSLKILVVEAILVSVDAGHTEITSADMRIAFERVLDETTGANPWAAK